MYWKSHIVRFSCLTLSKSFRGFSRLRSKMFPSIGQTGGPGGKFLGLRDLSWMTMKTMQINSRIIDANMVEGTELKSLLLSASVSRFWMLTPVVIFCSPVGEWENQTETGYTLRGNSSRIWLELPTKISVYIVLNFFRSLTQLLSWLVNRGEYSKPVTQYDVEKCFFFQIL